MKLKELHEASDSLQIYKHNTHYNVKFADKDSILRLCLWEIKNGEGTGHVVKYWIKRCRDAGFDYQEFKAIEKSIGKLAEAELHENRYATSDGILHHEPNGTMLVKFKDKKAFLKMCLRELKDGEEWVT